VKRIALSLAVIAASGAYVWNQSGRAAPDDLLGAQLQIGGDQPGGIAGRIPVSTGGSPPAILRPAPFVIEETRPAPAVGASASAISPAALPATPLPPPPALPAPSIADATPLPVEPALLAPAPADAPRPRRRPLHEPIVGAKVTRVAMTLATSAGYADGTYVGPVVDAYYGLIQIEAIVQGGQLVGIKVLKYPSDRRTSVYINRQALPMLRDEVVSAQSANVDIISGATLTSEAFIRSLGSALRKARS
jgi:uncharacterized protein with FMN-binding domain